MTTWEKSSDFLLQNMRVTKVEGETQKIVSTRDESELFPLSQVYHPTLVLVDLKAELREHLAQPLVYRLHQPVIPSLRKWRLECEWKYGQPTAIVNRQTKFSEEVL
jgi:hypothetical protein